MTNNVSTEPAFHIGHFPVWRIQEWEGTFAPPEHLFAEFEEAPFAAEADGFTPDYLQDGLIYAFLQSWLIDANGTKIIVDTGAGNDKDRPNIPVFGNLKTGFLENLHQTGFLVEDIDIVINTHLHIDHVGWNTSLKEGTWHPTFPNARYIFPVIDRDAWDPTNEGFTSMRGHDVNLNVFEDSVQPILDAGKATLVGDGFEILKGLVMTQMPGHTPGHMMLEVHSNGECAFFTGDILHHPMQVIRPDWNSVYCEDPITAAATRRHLLERAVKENARIVPAHFGGTHSTFIRESKQGFRPTLECYSPTGSARMERS